MTQSIIYAGLGKLNTQRNKFDISFSKNFQNPCFFTNLWVLQVLHFKSREIARPILGLLLRETRDHFPNLVIIKYIYVLMYNSIHLTFTLFRNKTVALNQMFQWNASKLVFFCFSFSATLLFSYECPGYVREKVKLHKKTKK